MVKNLNFPAIVESILFDRGIFISLYNKLNNEPSENACLKFEITSRRTSLHPYFAILHLFTADLAYLIINKSDQPTEPELEDFFPKLNLPPPS